ncbi:MAG: uncharacterized protein QOI59_4914, partial [Gammaproteobacteria bacterium]|nr:uncharacterized protein [Gammaproteobacteria bacterium]
LLHNFRVSAGLPPKGAVYGGWESESLAGHSLGHYLSACSLMFAQTGEAQYRQRVDYIVAELAQCQSAHGDGYVAGFTRKRGDVMEDGKAIFPEIVKGDIRSFPFALNGAWSPLYTLHKLFAGLLDANEYCGNAAALKVAKGLGTYLDGVFSKLSDEQMQQMLVCEYGGLNESFLQLYERNTDARWLAIARRIYDHKVLDPLARQSDELVGLHSNTQVPKIIGIARLHELTREAPYGTAAQFFWQTVTQNHSYVIGGNADRESFEAPLSKYVTEQTCEACNTYNMLKLTRILYQWQPDAAYFDYYERAHLNHILAQHDPDTGMFAYMMPLMTGARREFSTPFDDFWCCVGTGMESHSKHGDSIYWKRGEQLFVNLYIPSELTWKEQGATLAMRTDYPFAGDVIFETTQLEQPRTFAVAFRIPGWCESAGLMVNGRPATTHRQGGYLTVRRRWVAGDRVELKLAMGLRAEPIRDDADLVALMYGSMVMAADLGPASDPFEGAAPALVGATAADAVGSIGKSMNTGAASRPMNLQLKPFFSQYDRRSAVYFPRLTEGEWQAEQSALKAEQARVADLEARSVDVLRLGERQSEHDHLLKEGKSETVLYRGRTGRWARNGTSFEFRMRSSNEPLALQATYWGKQRNSRFKIFVDGVQVATESMDGGGPIAFVARSYKVPHEVTKGKQFVVVRFEPEVNAGAGPVFGCLMCPVEAVTVTT